MPSPFIVFWLLFANSIPLEYKETGNELVAIKKLPQIPLPIDDEYQDTQENANNLEQLSYRRPMRVTAIVYFPQCHPPVSFPRCPRCEITMEREYQSYCDRCGQQLSWRGYGKHTTVIIIQPRDQSP